MWWALAAPLMLSGCADPKTLVAVHLESCEAGEPIARVELEVFPPLRILPSFPKDSSITDSNGNARLRIPTGDRPWQCTFWYRCSHFNALFNADLAEPLEFHLTAQDDPKTCVRVIFDVLKR